MSDNITLRRAVEQVREALKELDYASEPYVNAIARAIRTELDAALAEPDAKPEPVAFAKNGNLFWCGDASQMRGVDIDLYPAPPQPDATREPVAWMHEFLNPFDEEDTAFRTAAEMHRAEKMQHVDRAVWTPLYLAPPQPDATREPATDATDNRRVWDAYIEACREFERFHGITKEDK